MLKKENKMGTMPINKLILSMSIPMMTSMIIQALYNVVDSIFVAQINEQALTAVSLAFPIQNLMIAVQVGTGVGMSALLARQLGEGNEKGSRLTAANGIFLSLAQYLVFLVLGFTIVDKFFSSQTNDPIIQQYGKEYLSIIMIFSLGLFIQIIMERLLQSTGRAVYSMYTQGLGAIVNIILDPILIFGWFGLPAMGVAGAAYATVIGQTLGALMGIYFQFKKNSDLDIDVKAIWRPDKKIIKDIYRVGIPSMVMTSITSVTTFAMNNILIAFTPTATAVYGVYFKLQSFVFMPVHGLNNGVVPILAYNFGARNSERMEKIIKYSVGYAMGITILGLAIFQLFPEALFSMFNPSAAMLEIGIPALRIISLHFLLAGFCIVSSTVFQAFGRGMISLTVSVIRQLVVLIPVAYALSLTGTLSAIWWAYPIAEIFSAILCVIFMRYIFKKYVYIESELEL